MPTPFLRMSREDRILIRQLMERSGEERYRRMLVEVLRAYGYRVDEELLQKRVEEAKRAVEEKEGLLIAVTGSSKGPEEVLAGERPRRVMKKKAFIPRWLLEKVGAGMAVGGSALFLLGFLGGLHFSLRKMEELVEGRRALPQWSYIRHSSPVIAGHGRGLARMAEEVGLEEAVLTLNVLYYFLKDEKMMEVMFIGYGETGLHPYYVVAMLAAENGGMGDMTKEGIGLVLRKGAVNHFISPAGAEGIGQVMPATFRQLRHRIPPSLGPAEIDNPYANALVAYYYTAWTADMLKEMGAFSEGNLAVAYNCGLGCVGEPLPEETRRHVEKYLKALKVLKEVELDIRRGILNGYQPYEVVRILKVSPPAFDDKGVLVADSSGRLE